MWVTTEAKGEKFIRVMLSNSNLIIKLAKKALTFRAINFS